MITKEKAKKILEDNGEEYTEKELEMIYEVLSKHAKIILKDFKKKKTQDARKI